VRGLPVSIGVATLAALAVAGCAGPLSPTPVLSPHPITAAPDQTPYLVANAPEQAILRIDVEGIFAVSDGLPALALYGDGLVLKDPNTTACCSYSGPLLPAIVSTRLSASEIQTVLRASDKAGLMGASAQYRADITDANQTTYTVIVAGVEHKVASYGDGSDPRPNKAELMVLDGFFDQVYEHLDGLLGRQVVWDPYQPSAIEITVQEPWNWHGPQSGEPAWIWPLITDPGSVATTSIQPGYGCMVITGSDIEAFTAAARGAPAGSVWSARSGPWELKARPAIPGAPPCTGGW